MHPQPDIRLKQTCPKWFRLTKWSLPPNVRLLPLGCNGYQISHIFVMELFKTSDIKISVADGSETVSFTVIVNGKPYVGNFIRLNLFLDLKFFEKANGFGVISKKPRKLQKFNEFLLTKIIILQWEVFSLEVYMHTIITGVKIKNGVKF